MRRPWLMRLSAMAVMPLLLIGSLELTLRLIGFGYPTGFFLPAKISGHNFYAPNLKFGYRFFPHALPRSPMPMRMPAEKPANAYLALFQSADKSSSFKLSK